MANVALADPTPELDARYDKAGTAFVSKSKLFETEIGDVFQPDFQPQVKVKRWANELNFSVRLSTAEPADVTYDGAAIVYTTPTLAARFYDKGFEEDTGGFEFAIHLLSAPASNVLTFTIQTKGLQFYYQGPLSDREKARGAVRPDDVLGSYAVFHASQRGDYSAGGGQNYRAGKAFHLYRPWAEDAKAVRVWCDLHIDEANGAMTITIPQDFLDAAVYPVLVDPTFGYTTIGGTQADFNANEFDSTTGTPAGSGTCDSYSAYAWSDGGAAQFKGVLALASTKAIVANGVSDANTPTTSGSWRTAVFSTPPSVTAVAYFIGIIWDSSTLGSDHMKFDTGGGTGNELYDNSNSFTTPTNPSDGSTFDDWLQSNYITYTASGGRTTKNTRAFPLGTELGMNWQGAA